MFDLYTGNVRHMPHRTALPILVSSSVQGTVLVALALVSFLIATRELPAVPDVLAFVAELPAAVPPARSMRPEWEVPACAAGASHVRCIGRT
jgi:hypothetical protein